MKVIVGIVSRGNDINTGLARWLYNLRDSDKVEYNVLTERSPHSAQAGQEILLKKLEGMSFDYVFLTDSDVVVEDDVVGKLIDVGKDVVIGPTWHYDFERMDIHLDVHTTDVNARLRYPKDSGVERIVSSSLSCMLLSRRVFDKFKDAKMPYTTQPEEGLYESDNIFYFSLRKLGIEAYVRWDIKTTHMRYVDLNTETLDKFLVQGTIDKFMGKT